MRRIAAYIFILFAAKGLSQVRLQATLDSSNILIGDQVHLTVTIQQPKGLIIAVPSIKDSIVSKVEVLDSRVDTLAKSDSGIIIRHALLLTSFDSGLYVIPGIRYPFVYQGHADTLIANQLQLMVNTIPVDSTKPIFDIKPILKVPISFREMLPYILWGLLAAAIIAAAVYFLRKIKRNEPIFVERKITEPAHVIAFRDLEKLKEQKIWQQGKVKEYYSILTGIIRMYIERRFEIPAMESTTFEIMADLKRTGLPDEQLYSGLSNLLQSADLVKFAKSQPLPDENEISYTTAYDFVVKTKKEIVLTEEEPSTESVEKKEEGL